MVTAGPLALPFNAHLILITSSFSIRPQGLVQIHSMGPSCSYGDGSATILSPRRVLSTQSSLLTLDILNVLSLPYYKTVAGALSSSFGEPSDFWKLT